MSTISVRLFLSILAIAPLAAQSVSVSSPANASVHVGNSVIFQCALTSAPSTRTCEFWLDGKLEGIATTREGWRYDYRARRDPDSNHSLIAIAKDALGATVATSSAINFRTKNGAGCAINAAYDQPPPFTGYVQVTLTHCFNAAPLGYLEMSLDDEPMQNGFKVFSKSVAYGIRFEVADVDNTNNWINVPGHGLWLGKEVDFNPTSDDDGIGSCTQGAPLGLTGQQFYYAVPLDSTRVQWATSFANALAGTPLVDLVSGVTCSGGAGFTWAQEKSMYFVEHVGTSGRSNGNVFHINTNMLRDGAHRLYARIGVRKADADNSTRTFATTDVNTTTGVVTQTDQIVGKPGQPLTLTTTGTLPTGWALSTTYYACGVNANSWTIFTTQAAAQAAGLAGTCTTGNLVPSTQGSGTHSYVATLQHDGYAGTSVYGDGTYWMADQVFDFTVANNNQIVEIRPRSYLWSGIVGGATIPLAPVVAVDSEGDKANLTSSAVAFRSEDTTYATVDTSGNITCVAPGFVKVWVEYIGHREITFGKCDTSTRFYHFSQAGTVITTYDAANSFFMIGASTLDAREMDHVNGGSKPANAVGGMVLKDIIGRTGFNVYEAGVDGNVVAQATDTAYVASWKNLNKGQFERGCANYPMLSILRTDGFATNGGWASIVYNAPAFSSGTYATRALMAQDNIADMQATACKPFMISPQDEVNLAYKGDDPLASSLVGGGYFTNVVVSGCSATPCRATCTVGFNASPPAPYDWVLGHSGATAAPLVANNIVRIHGSSTNLDRYHLISTSWAGGTFQTKCRDIVDGTYNSGSHAGMNLVFHFAAHDFMLSVTTASVSVGGTGTGAATATVTQTAHGLTTSDSLCILGITSDTDLNGCYPILSTPDASTFTMEVWDVSAGTYTSASGTGVRFRAPYRGSVGKVDGNIFADYKTIIAAAAPTAAWAPETVGGSKVGWNSTPYAATAVASLNATTDDDGAYRNGLAGREIKYQLAERGMRTTSRNGRGIDSLYIHQLGVTGIEMVRVRPVGVCEVRFGEDKSVHPGIKPNAISQVAMSLPSLGAGGMKAYSFAGYTNSRFGWCNGVTLGATAQYNADFLPNGNNENAYAESRAFRLIQRFNKCFVGPIINTISLGPFYITGARDCNGSGKLLIMTWYGHGDRTETIDVSDYKAGLTNQLYRLNGYRLSSAESLADASSYNVTFKEGDSVAIFFPASAADQSLTTRTFSFSLPSGATKAILYTNYIWWDEQERNVSITDCDGTSPCTLTVDRNMGDLLYRFRYTNSSGTVIAESDVRRIQ